MSHLDKNLDQADLKQIFQTFGEIEEMFCFKKSSATFGSDSVAQQGDAFKGCIFIKYKLRRQALKAITLLSMKGMQDNKYAA